MWPIVLSILLLQTPAAASAPAPALAPALTEVDRLLWENANLQERLVRAIEATDACATALAPHRAAENREIATRAKERARARIEAAHPGYQLTEAGTLEKRLASAPAIPPTP